MIQPMRRSVTASSKKCMLTLSTACQVKPIRIGLSYDPANGKGRLAVLKEVLKWKVKPVRSSVSYGSANEKARLAVFLQSQPMRIHDPYVQPMKRSVPFSRKCTERFCKSVQPLLRCLCCGSGSGIQCLFDPWLQIRNGKKSGSGIRNEHPRSFSWELRNSFLC